MAAALAGPFAAVAGLLAVAGALKLPDRRLRWRALGVGEVVVGVAAVAVGGAALAAAVAVAYAAFAAYLLHRRPADCGCFGAPAARPAADPTRTGGAPVLQAVLDLVAAALAAAAAAAGVGPLSEQAAAGPAHFAVWAALTALVVVLAQLSMTTLPKTLAAVRGQ